MGGWGLKPSEIFIQKLFPLGAVPHGTEDQKYRELLQLEGFVRKPGAWVLRPEAQIILAAHLDTVNIQEAKVWSWSSEGVVKGINGAIFGDDKAGVALVLYLHTRLPEVGFALFLGEEVGQWGSQEARDANLFPKARAMISLDRMGKEEIIYAQKDKQTGEPVETGSREAAEWLAAQLGMGHHASEKGSRTDSYTFKDVIPECLNVAVGYDDPHTVRDTQDLHYLDQLGERLARVQWAAFPVHRALQR